MKLKGYSAKTIDHREKMLARLAAVLPVPLLDATPAMLYDWRDRLDGRVKNATAAGYISHVACFYRWAVDQELLAANPAAKLPVPKVPRLLPRPIVTADLVLALDHAGRTMRAMLLLAAYAGLRVEEIAGLRAENVRMHDHPPYIHVVSEATKGITERVVPLSPALIGELVMAGLPPATGPVFPNASGGHFEAYMITKMISNHLHNLGISSTAHKLRHWFATTGYAIGNDILALQELLGHARLETTANYAKLNRARTAALVNAMPPPDTLGRQEAS
jgi:site-specific recombinase XerD